MAKTKPTEVKKNEVEEWKNKYLRALADYQNLEKRTEEQITRQKSESKKKLLLKFLHVFDNIERAEIFVEDQGLMLIKEQFANILKDEKVKELDLLRKPFDPYLAECIEVVDGEKDNIVVEIIRKGYKIDHELLRPAQVKVTKKS